MSPCYIIPQFSLQLNIPGFKDSKDDWKPSGQSRLYSFFNSSQDSSVEYSSDTCSNQSNGAYLNENLWGKSEIWAPPSFDSLKKSV